MSTYFVFPGCVGWATLLEELVGCAPPFATLVRCGALLDDSG